MRQGDFRGGKQQILILIIIGSPPRYTTYTLLDRCTYYSLHVYLDRFVHTTTIESGLSRD
jgi:hypothetical protein